MNEIKKEFKGMKVFKYIVFAFAFICMSFIFSSSKVAAAPVISIPTEDDFEYDDGLTFYIGYDTWTVNSVEYSFDNSTWHVIEKPESNYSNIYKSKAAKSLCSSKDYIGECTSVILAYTIPKGDLPNSKSTGVNSKGEFTIYVASSNRTALVLGGESSASRVLPYDKTGPSVKKVTVTASSNNMKAGSKLTFTVEFNEQVNVTYGAKVSFKIGSASKTALCTTNSTLSNTMTCSYTVLSGDNGSISSVALTGTSYIKDDYSNTASSSISSSSVYGISNISVDTTSPKIISILASKGVFSKNNTVVVEVSFSENIKQIDSTKRPVLVVKFGDGENITCNFDSSATNKMFYNCSVGEKDQGEMKIVSLTNNRGFSDASGNYLNLTLGTYSFSDTIADNEFPSIDKISITSDCGVLNGNYYCVAGKEIVVSFEFNMPVSNVNANNVKMMFGSVRGSGSISSEYYDVTNTFTITYTVVKSDNGRFVLEYTFNVLGYNGLAKTLTGENEYNYYVDNENPSINSDIEVYIGETLMEDKIIYSSIDKQIDFVINVEDDSKITLNKNKIYLVDSNNNQIYSSDTGIKYVLVSEENGRITFSVVIKDSIKIAVKIKIERDAIVDSLQNRLTSDFYSDEYILDCESPEFEVEINYPKYKGYKKGDNWVLVSGNTIDFVIKSENTDLKEYCAYSYSDSECEYNELSLNTVYSFTFASSVNKSHSFYVKVRDMSSNESVVKMSFVLQNMFDYSNGAGSTGKEHVITVDTSMLNNGEKFKYSWFNGSYVNFASANISEKDASNKFAISGGNPNHGEYRVCILIVSSNDILCSEYVNFDNKIDLFEVEIDNNWTKSDLSTMITFNDASAVECIAVGKNVSSLDCYNGGDNKVIYRASQISSPFTKYTIEENGTYYFYIQDKVGNSKIIDRTVNNIDKTPIDIEIFNGNSGSYNTNLEVDSYKNNHKFSLAFDRNSGDSPVNEYKYFFTRNVYSISNKDSFDIYYYDDVNLIKAVVSTSSKSATISAPSNVSGIYNLYIMATDKAGNVSFASVLNIKIDGEGPLIKMFNSRGEETNGGSDTFIRTFDYSIEIEERYSGLNLNQVYYRWVDASTNVAVFEKNYSSCSFDYNVCKISGEDIELEAGIFNPSSSYKLVVIARDYANNESIFTSNAYKIDTTPASIVFDIDESKWYTTNSFTFTVSKNNNGTLSSIAYCLNDCVNYKELGVGNSTSDTKTVVLALNEGVNVLNVKATDEFGNVATKSVNIKYDSKKSEVIINNLNSNGVVDLRFATENVIDFTINDASSGVKKYCLYFEESLVKCENTSGTSITRKHTVTVNGNYYVEAYDNAGLVYKHSVTVVGFDKDPISFDLISNVADGKYTNSDVVISLVNMRKFMDDDISDNVKTIDYIKTNSYAADYSSLFVDAVSVYNNLVNNQLVTSFTVSENNIYVVRVIDTGDNVSYNTIKIESIDRGKPNIDTSKISLTTSSGKNIVLENDGSYKYSNETLQIKFDRESFNDSYTGFNRYLTLKVCFEENESCVYNTYNINVSVNGAILINTSTITISAPYRFEGDISYYVVDGAGNESSKYSFTALYQDGVSEFDVALEDQNGNEISEEKQYNSVVMKLSDVSVGTTIKYALISSSIDLKHEYNNKKITDNQFLDKYKFAASSNKVNVTKAQSTDPDGDYYIWLYASDELGNYELFNLSTLIKIDTTAPKFDEIGYVINRIGDSNYDLIVNNNIYNIYIDSDMNGEFELVELEDGKYNFSVSGVNSVNLQLEDAALNKSEILTVMLNEVSSEPYGRVYQNGNGRTATVVVYNLGNKSLSFSYVVDSVDSRVEYKDNSIDDLELCVGNDTGCIKNSFTGSKGVYTVTSNEDRKLVFYIYVDGVLIHDKTGKLLTIDLMVDDIKPVVDFDDYNPSVISTHSNKYTFVVRVSEAHKSNRKDIKYVLTKDSSITDFDSYYNSCLNSSNCARGVYDLNDELVGNIVINSNASSFYNLSSGSYYIYTYVDDDYGNYKVQRSALIYVDNDNPSISYSDVNGSYKEANGDVFVGQATTLKFSDAKGVKSFNVLNSSGEIITTCDVVNSSNDYNCDRENSYNSVGSAIYYQLDTGSYSVVAYDVLGNSKTVSIGIDGDTPVIKLFKLLNGNYLEQPNNKTYNSLDNLYLKVIDANFNYLIINLNNTTVGRYSYNSEQGKCLNECEYGVSFEDMVVANTGDNTLVITAYDKAGKSSQLTVNYDDGVPVIWTKDIEEGFRIDGYSYVINSDMSIDIEIGVNKTITLDKLLSNVILNIDGYSYSEIKSNDLFSVAVYKYSNSQYVEENGNIFDYIGKYKIEINYTDDAGNEAESKVIYVNVVDSMAPSMDIGNVVSFAELNKEVNISPVIVRENYGLDDTMLKEKVLYLKDASSCMIDGEICTNYIVTVRDGTYKFIKSGTYEFVYSIKDISLNSNSVSYSITVRDSEGPSMSVTGSTNREIEIRDRNLDGTINVESITVGYPVAFDYGDQLNRNVNYVGLFALNSMSEKYKVDQDVYKIVDDGNVLTYKFSKIGTYYLRFTSVDSKDNTSIFEYEIVVVDNIKPVISGISDGQTIEISLDMQYSFSIENIVENYNIKVSDNYDDNVKLNYVRDNNDIVFSVSDTSNNRTSITVHLNIVDNEAPTVGTLKVSESTNLNNLPFEIVGGFDNSNNWKHQYNINNGKWFDYVDGVSSLSFGEGVSQIVTLCIRAIDSSNTSSSVCKSILVDTKAPVIKGIKNGEISDSSVTLTIEDDRLSTVKAYKDDKLMTLDVTNLPFVFEEKGKYTIEAVDSLGNIANIHFMIDDSIYMDIVNDINADEYTITSVEYDSRSLVKVDIEYDKNGNSVIVARLDNISVSANSTIYILGVVPGTTSNFVMYSFNGTDANQYRNGVRLLNGQEYFKTGVNNEDCFVEFDGSYYAYLIEKDNSSDDQTVVVNKENGNNDNSGFLKTVLIILGSLITLVIGYQIIKLRRRVRAA